MRVLVLGGGPAGVTAALHAAELGAEVTLVERGRVGGTALNSGPAPVRTLARAARLVRDWGSWETFGLRGPRPEVDLAATLANAERVAGYAYERRRVADHIRAMGVDLVEEGGDAWFLDAKTVVVADGRTWTADRVMIAVGGRAGRLSVPGAELGLTYQDVRGLAALPDRVCVIAAADTGCQLASILADFGCQVSLIEYAPRIVPRADQDISAALERAFRERGIQVMTSAGVERLEPLQAGVRMVAACMAAGMRIEEVAELQFAFPTFTEGVSQAAQMLVRELGVRPMPSSGAASAHHRRRARGDGRGGGVHDRPAPARRRGPLGRPPRRAAAGGHHGRARLPRPVGDDGALVPVGSGVCAR